MNQPQKPQNSGQEAPSGVEAGQGQGRDAEAGWRAYGTATPAASFEERIHALAQALADPGFRTRLAGTLIDKHNDYGRSGVRPPELAQHISAPDGILVRESDKLARLRQLQQRGYTPKVAESIEDTAFDLVGYAALLYLAIQDEQQRATEDAAIEAKKRIQVSLSTQVPDLTDVDRYIRAVLASPHASEETKESIRRWPGYGAHFDEPQPTGDAP